ncbi:MAG: GFA family protein [Myxococcales bacterium]|nr:GFA family protein [Myxococcales bacterium]
MDITGRCYCGAVRFSASGDPLFKAQCHCRECQYISGGAPNVVLGMSGAGFSYTQGEPKAFSRSDLDAPVVREFCGECGTHLVSKPPSMPGLVILKVGTFDDPSVYGKPDMAIFLCDKQSFHQVPDGVATFERGPS